MRSLLTTLAMMAAVTAATGCFEAPRPNCAFLCGTDSSCPTDYVCAADGWCKRADVAPNFVCEPGTVDAAVPDAPPDIDAPDIDAPDIDAPGIDAAVDAPIDAPIDAAPASLEIITAGPLDFGAVRETVTATQPVMVRNSGGVASSALTVNVTGAGFGRVTGVTDTCSGATLAPLASCSFTASFSPTVIGAHSGVASVSATEGGNVSINLSGGFLPALTATMTNLDFGDVTQSTTADRTVTFTNAGTIDTATLAVARTGDAAFAIQTDTCDGQTITPTNSCAVTIRFAPTAAGAVTGQLSLTGRPGGPWTIPLTGTGI